MSLADRRTVLVLGGIGSGRLEVARSLLADARTVAATDGGLPALSSILAAAGPEEALLVDALEQWLPPARGGGRTGPATELAAAVRDSRARTILVSREVGLSTDPTTAGGRALAGSLAELNRALAREVDAVVLVVAGQPIWLKGGPAPPGAAAHTAAIAAPSAVVAGTAGGEAGGGGVAAPSGPADLGRLPLPDEKSQQAAADRLAGAGLGALTAAVTFAAATQANAMPAPWHTVRTLVLRGDHQGAAAAGAVDSALLAAALGSGTGPLADLAAAAGTAVQLVEVAAAAPIEEGPALPNDEAADRALDHGWHLAGEAAGDGADLLVLGSIGSGADTAAAAVVAALGGTGAEVASLLGRVRAPDGTLDDAAWMRRCAAVRDALRRVRSAARTAAGPVLADLGGADLATAAGIILGAAANRVPVLLDGPVGAAAAQAARALAAPARRWCLVPDTGGHPTVVRVCELLGLAPVLDLRFDLGEGAASLAALPLLRSALHLAATTTTTPPPPPPADQGKTDAIGDQLA
jgi:nicotinate-nucleotide--dimethylbenzimidazole phosphoribosyltransferase